MKEFLILFLVFLKKNGVVGGFTGKSTVFIGKDVAPSIEPINTVRTPSLMLCSAQCTMNSKCQSYAFKSTTCALYDSAYSPDEGFQLKTAVGFVYYSVKVPRPVMKVYKHDPLTWRQAIKFCESKKRRLVCITSEEIQKQVIEAMKKENVVGKAWIGLKSINLKRDFEWINGMQFHVDSISVDSKDPFYTWNPKMTIDHRKFEVAVVILGSDYGSNAYKWADEDINLTFRQSVCELV